MTKFDGIAQGVALYMCWSLAHYVYNINKIHSYCLAKERISVANSRSPSRLCFRHLAAHVHYSRHIKTVTHANYYVVNDVCPTELQTKKKKLQTKLTVRKREFGIIYTRLMANYRDGHAQFRSQFFR